jgi:hypothetical protein
MAVSQGTARAQSAEERPSWVHELVGALREAIDPAQPDRIEVATVDYDNLTALDRAVFCVNCLSKDGSSWMGWKKFWHAADQERPGRIKRIEEAHNHPEVRKTLSYDAKGVREGLDKGTYGKQCIQCGIALGGAA